MLREFWRLWAKLGSVSANIDRTLQISRTSIDKCEPYFGELWQTLTNFGRNGSHSGPKLLELVACFGQMCFNTGLASLPDRAFLCFAAQVAPPSQHWPGISGASRPPTNHLVPTQCHRPPARPQALSVMCVRRLWPRPSSVSGKPERTRERQAAREMGEAQAAETKRCARLHELPGPRGRQATTRSRLARRGSIAVDGRDHSPRNRRG